MAKNIPDLGSLSSSDPTDLLEIYDVSANTNKRITVDGLVPNNAITYAKLLSTIFSGQVATQTNSGSAGGTMYYVNLGGIKLLWGLSAQLNVPGSAPTANAFNVNFPSSFFSAVQTFLPASAGPYTNTSACYANTQSWTASAATFNIQITAGGNGYGYATYIAIGS